MQGLGVWGYGAWISGPGLTVWGHQLVFFIHFQSMVFFAGLTMTMAHEPVRIRRSWLRVAICLGEGKQCLGFRDIGLWDTRRGMDFKDLRVSLGPP